MPFAEKFVPLAVYQYFSFPVNFILSLYQSMLYLKICFQIVVSIIKVVLLTVIFKTVLYCNNAGPRFKTAVS